MGPTVRVSGCTEAQRPNMVPGERMTAVRA
jgi:hypothetical protein